MGESSAKQQDEPERWAPYPSDPRYQVSSLGRVRSLARTQEKFLKPTATRGGYVRVDIGRTGTRRTRPLHHVVLEAFVGPRPQGREAAHRDGDKLNNRLSNLRWATRAENSADSVRLGQQARGSRIECAQLTEGQVEGILELLANGCSQSSIARAVGVKNGTIWRIANGRNWRHVIASKETAA